MPRFLCRIHYTRTFPVFQEKSESFLKDDVSRETLRLFFLFLVVLPARGMVSRSGASDFVARQSHQNWFRNLRFLKTSLAAYCKCRCKPRRVRNESTMLFLSGVTPYIGVIDDACHSTTAPAAIYHDAAGGRKRPRSAIGTQTRVGALGKTQAPATTTAPARNARRKEQRQVRQRAPWLTLAVAA